MEREQEFANLSGRLSATAAQQSAAAAGISAQAALRNADVNLMNAETNVTNARTKERELAERERYQKTVNAQGWVSAVTHGFHELTDGASTIARIAKTFG